VSGAVAPVGDRRFGYGELAVVAAATEEQALNPCSAQKDVPKASWASANVYVPDICYEQMVSLRGSSLALVVCAACAASAAEQKPVTPAASSAASAPTGSPPPPPTSQPPAPATATEVLASNRAAFDTCYARAREQRPTLGRTSVEMTFTIDAEGRPTNVDLRYKHPIEDRLKECIRDAALALHFPASMQGQQSGAIVLSPPGP
jgi:hypothetical protein